MLLEKPDLSMHSRVAIQLRLAEKQILEKVSSSGREKRLYYQKKLEEGAPLPLYEESDIALLESTDDNAKLPILMHKLDEVDDDQAIPVEEHSHIMNGKKLAYRMKGNGKPQQVIQESISTDINQALDSNGNASTDQGQTELSKHCDTGTEEEPREAN